MNLLFRNMLSPGDLLMLTIAIRDLHYTYPNQFHVKIESSYPEIFYNNPYLKQWLDNSVFLEIIDLDYRDVFMRKNITGEHFSSGFIECINKKLNLEIKKTTPFPDIFLTEKEKSNDILSRLGIEKPFWIFNAGFKNDMPLKAYPPDRWIKVIDSLSKKGIQLIQTGHSYHIHPTFNNIKSLIGETDNLRDYFSLMNHAEGAIGAISLQTHVAAAFNKPCVVIAGGREQASWVSYNGQVFLSSVGFLDCCKVNGCWKKQKYDCKHLTKTKMTQPQCMNLIQPEEIINAVLKYEGLK